MIKRAITLCLIFLAGFCSTLRADTGTYEILDYQVVLAPSLDGRVKMDYYQKWLVTGGHIPWITVGLPNSDFSIIGSGHAVGNISSANSGQWSGVRIDLDRDYMPAESFEVSFSILQSGLFYPDRKRNRLDYIPGWYDRAGIDNLTVTLKPIGTLDGVIASPEPTQIIDNTMVWQLTDLPPGKKFRVSVSFPGGLYQVDIPAKATTPRQKSGGGGNNFSCVLVPAFLIAFFMIFIGVSRRRYSGRPGHYDREEEEEGYSGGRTYHADRKRRRYYSACVFSCACACVSCACACACAGGGGAGCSRKDKHSCPVCSPEVARASDELKTKTTPAR